MLRFSFIARSHTLSTPPDRHCITELTHTLHGLLPPAITWNKKEIVSAKCNIENFVNDRRRHAKTEAIRRLMKSRETDRSNVTLAGWSSGNDSETTVKESESRQSGSTATRTHNSHCTVDQHIMTRRIYDGHVKAHVQIVV